jgi:hypothetical protein
MNQMSTDKNDQLMAKAHNSSPLTNEGLSPVEPQKESLAKKKSSKKKKDECETLEQFLEYAYKQKGRKIVLSRKDQKIISKSVEISDDNRTRLLDIAKTDTILIVPRQILLTCCNISDYPKLRHVLHGFVQEVLEDSSYFKSINISAMLSNLPQAPTFREVMEVLPNQIVEVSAKMGKRALTVKNFEQLINNIANILVLWCASVRGTSIDEIVEMLYESFWAKQAMGVKRSDEKLRLLTDISQPHAVGLVCQIFYQKAKKQSKEASDAWHKSDLLQQRLDETIEQAKTLEQKLIAAQADLSSAVVAAEAQQKMQRDEYEIKLIHHLDDTEKLRTRILRLMNENIEQLGVGISALKSSVPKPQVAIERIEIAVEKMRNEISRLKGFTS